MPQVMNECRIIWNMSFLSFIFNSIATGSFFLLLFCKITIRFKKVVLTLQDISTDAYLVAVYRKKTLPKQENQSKTNTDNKPPV